MKFGYMNNPYLDVFSEIDVAKNAGLDFLELTIEWPMATADYILQEKEKLRSRLEEAGLEVVTHAPWYIEIGHPYARVRKAAIEELRKVVDASAEVESELLTVHPHTPRWVHGKEFKSQIVEANIESLAELTDYASERGVVVAIENVDHGFFKSVKSLVDITNRIPKLMFTLDVGHACIQGSDMEKLRSYVSNLYHKLVHLHIHDNLRDGSDLHLAVGAGEIDWRAVYRELAEIGYDERACIEVHVGDIEWGLKISLEAIRFFWK
ncbi:MAG: hypothetical protein DRN99_02720 [Thermoproteota archaeon]|nr:MAG: hypothetical protein DRN99_02720 [Candidatus Korarchaeota archaeon]